MKGLSAGLLVMAAPDVKASSLSRMARETMRLTNLNLPGPSLKRPTRLRLPQSATWSGSCALADPGAAWYAFDDLFGFRSSLQNAFECARLHTLRSRNVARSPKMYNFFARYPVLRQSGCSRTDTECVCSSGSRSEVYVESAAIREASRERRTFDADDS